MPNHEYVIMLTRRCNFRCTYCYQAHDPVDQDVAVVERVAASVRARAERRDPQTARDLVVLHGGEPLLRKALVHHTVELLLDEAGERLCDFAIVTNGSLLDDGVLELFARHHFRVDVSFDGCREAQAFRDAGSFELVLENLRRLIDLHGRGLLELRVAMTLTLDNLPYLARSVKFLTDLGAPTILIEGDGFGPWREGAEKLLEEQVEEVVQAMQLRLAAGLPVPVRRLAPLPSMERPRSTQSVLSRLASGECGCGAEGASVIDADGSVWACPLFIPDLGKVASGRLKDPDAFRLGAWTATEEPNPAQLAARAQELKKEPILGPKRERWSRFGTCSTCRFVADCTACPAASHLPDVRKTPQEVPPLLCAINMAFLARRERMRRAPNLTDILFAVAGA